jgi:hypothetical protein
MPYINLISFGKYPRAFPFSFLIIGFVVVDNIGLLDEVSERLRISVGFEESEDSFFFNSLNALICLRLSMVRSGRL